MKHVFYALFENHPSSEAALMELKSAGITEDRYSVILHEDAYTITEEEDLKIVETDAREGLIGGVALGGLAGALGAALLTGPPGLVGIGPLVVALAVGGLGGGVYGGLGSFLFSLGIPDRSLAKLAEHLKPGRVLMTVETDDRALEKRIEAVFERHGAVAREKHLI